MPNGNRRGGRDRGNYYKGNEHDDRVPLPQDGTRRVSFKNHRSGRHKSNHKRAWDNKLRVLMDDDVDMSSTVHANERAGITRHVYFSESFQSDLWRKIKNNFHNHRRRDGPGGDRWKGKPLPESPTYWYKVIIVRCGNKYPKDYLLKLMASYIKPLTLVPIGYKMGRDENTFAVDDHQVAAALASADKRITTTDGWKLMIRVRPFTPMVEVDPALTTLMKRVMGSRYNAAMKALDMKKFHCDPQILSEDILCPLNRPNIMMAALDIISESTPDLLALDLSDNNINATDHMKIITDKCPHLKILHIGNNKLRDVKQLDALKGLPLEEVMLDGNSLCDKFNDKDSYIRAVRQRFPKVIKLDGIDLPPPILFDVEDEGKLPLSKPSFMASEAGAEIVKQFLHQYYQLYDTDGSREPLHQAYHESAQFSYDAYAPSSDPQFGSFGAYLQESRNLYRVSNCDKRVRLLKRGKLSIVEALNNLPRTRHDPTSFVVDLVVFTPHLIQLNVCGLFNEVIKKQLLRYFSRVFTIVSVGSGFCIMNDQLTILPPTAEQIKKVNKLKAEAAAGVSPAPVGVAQPQPPPLMSVNIEPPIPIAAIPDLAAKQQMVTTLSLNSGMNLLWSEKCLNETNWNYDQAMFAFTKLQKAGSIPAEAFVK